MSAWRIEVVDGADEARVESARTLFAEYHAWLGEMVCSRSLGAETDALPGVYAPPAGRLLLALDETLDTPLGIVGVRPSSQSPTEAEIKRLYVRDCARGAGLGHALAAEALNAAREMGYVEALLTTLPGSMSVALGMYRRLGFEESEPFYDHSHVAEGTPMSFMRRAL